MNTTQLQSIIKFWENKGHFNLDLYHKYLMASSENTTETFYEELTEGKHFTANIAYILIFILAALFIFLLNII